ncbi:hypothetical protein L6452_30876 [Arctium lappa]|uniref:Uncharacterized protein n=1 Tax=Arctium lappa TaxID=4217 RepID=A0ACB8ZKC8_ARCLA|nr:hypothetical protein L6452_30876 [Arctium lappa]
MYDVYYDLPLDYAKLIFREIMLAAIAKEEDQNRDTEPRTLVFNRPTTLSTGYPNARPLPARMLAYLGSEEGKLAYIRGHRTSELSPATPPPPARIGFQVGEEDQEKATEATTAKLPKKTKKKRLVKLVDKEKHKALTKDQEDVLREEPAEEEEVPLQRKRQRTLVFEIPEVEIPQQEKPPNPLMVATSIAKQIAQLYTMDIGATDTPVVVEDDTLLTSAEAFVASAALMSDNQTTSEVLVRNHNDPVGLDHPQSKHNIYLNVNIDSEGAKNSLAKSGPCVGLEVTLDTYVTKDEFKTFVDFVLRKLEELKSSIPPAPKEQNPNIVAEALKANTEALQELKKSCE